MSIHQIIAAINPDVFCEKRMRRQVKRILKRVRPADEIPDYLSAAAKAIPVEPNGLALEPLELENPFRLPGFKNPTEQHTLGYDNFEESLEAFYFWLLDELSADGWMVSKLADTFAATPASGLFSDLSRQESQAQREAMKMLSEAHGLVRDLLRAATYSKERPQALGSDETGERPFQPIERRLLKSKVESLKLYARWLGPYLRQARQLRQHDLGGSALLNLFNTAIVQATLLAQREYVVAEDVDRGELPRMFLNGKHRKYYSVLVIELKLRAAPERSSPGAYGYRGRFELTLTSYALNAEELTVLRRELDRENLDEVIHGLGDASAKTLNELVKELDALVTEPKQTEPIAPDPNPFFALFDFSEWFDHGEPIAESEGIVRAPRPDSEIEEVIRSQTLLDARRRCLETYHWCKQALKMPVWKR